MRGAASTLFAAGDRALHARYDDISLRLEMPHSPLPKTLQHVQVQRPSDSPFFGVERGVNGA